MLFGGQKPHKTKLIRRQTRHRQRPDDRTRPDNRHNGDALIMARLHQSITRVRDKRCASVRDKSNRLTALQSLYQPCRLCVGIMLMIGGGGRGYVKKNLIIWNLCECLRRLSRSRILGCQSPLPSCRLDCQWGWQRYIKCLSFFAFLI